MAESAGFEARDFRSDTKRAVEERAGAFGRYPFKKGVYRFTSHAEVSRMDEKAGSPEGIDECSREPLLEDSPELD